MQRLVRFILILVSAYFFACTPEPEVPDTEVPDTEDYYYPNNDNNAWETLDPDSLDWNSDKIEELYEFLESRDSRAFLLLYKGHIVLENYWGKNILGLSDFTKNTEWYWASAGKTLTSFCVGLAQEQGLLDIDDSTSDYLGAQWTNMTSEQEQAVKIYHHLTMTTGVDQSEDTNCNEPSCLTYKVDPNTEWYYHNGTYRLLFDIIASASNEPFEEYFERELKDVIGITGNWTETAGTNLFFSTARDMARFGILIQNQGSWMEKQVMSDQDYFNQMISTSQNINPSYGYLWWLNGKDEIVYPGTTQAFPLELASSAPDDLIAAIGKNGQFLSISNERDLIMIRMGDNPDDELVPTIFHDDLWEKINAVIGE